MTSTYRIFGGITNEEAKDQLKKRNKEYDKYLIIDGLHPVAFEIKEMKRRDKSFNGELMGEGAIQKVYRFPNGFGASVIRATFSMNYWESAELKFLNAYEKKRKPKNKTKRLKKKWFKRHYAGVSMLGDVERFADFADLEKQLEEIKNS